MDQTKALELIVAVSAVIGAAGWIVAIQLSKTLRRKTERLERENREYIRDNPQKAEELGYAQTR